MASLVGICVRSPHLERFFDDENPKAWDIKARATTTSFKGLKVGDPLYLFHLGSGVKLKGKPALKLVGYGTFDGCQKIALGSFDSYFQQHRISEAEKEEFCSTLKPSTQNVFAWKLKAVVSLFPQRLLPWSSSQVVRTTMHVEAAAGTCNAYTLACLLLVSRNMSTRRFCMGYVKYLLF